MTALAVFHVAGVASVLLPRDRRPHPVDVFLTLLALDLLVLAVVGAVVWLDSRGFLDLTP